MSEYSLFYPCSIIISACTSSPELTATALPTNTVFPTIGKNISVALPEGKVDGGRALNGWCTLCHGGLPSMRGPDFASSDDFLSITARAEERLAHPQTMQATPAMSRNTSLNQS